MATTIYIPRGEVSTNEIYTIFQNYKSLKDWHIKYYELVGDVYEIEIRHKESLKKWQIIKRFEKALEKIRK
ncbi:hypothetical protein ACQ1Q5_00250 [Ornithobacterium rhinotracheale]